MWQVCRHVFILQQPVERLFACQRGVANAREAESESKSESGTANRSERQVATETSTSTPAGVRLCCGCNNSLGNSRKLSWPEGFRLELGPAAFHARASALAHFWAFQDKHKHFWRFFNICGETKSKFNLFHSRSKKLLKVKLKKVIQKSP